uniref:Uncharacterized protein n=1 Tax=Phlebia radiata TaxID=5308 RepID=L8B960_PHLRA|nr:hypothetical protein PRA_mt0019 [Phlebia radiata]CCE89167.1 hypothetical protein PRA_mt0019 [Phlebia radiata]
MTSTIFFPHHFPICKMSSYIRRIINGIFNNFTYRISNKSSDSCPYFFKSTSTSSRNVNSNTSWTIYKQTSYSTWPWIITKINISISISILNIVIVVIF